MTHFNPPQINMKKKTKATINMTKLMAPETILPTVRLPRSLKVVPSALKLTVLSRTGTGVPAAARTGEVKARYLILLVIFLIILGKNW